MKECLKCGFQNDDIALFCDQCGEEMFSDFDSDLETFLSVTKTPLYRTPSFFLLLGGIFVVVIVISLLIGKTKDGTHELHRTAQISQFEDKAIDHTPSERNEQSGGTAKKMEENTELKGEKKIPEHQDTTEMPAATIELEDRDAPQNVNETLKTAADGHELDKLKTAPHTSVFKETQHTTAVQEKERGEGLSDESSAYDVEQAMVPVTVKIKADFPSTLIIDQKEYGEMSQNQVKELKLEPGVHHFELINSELHLHLRKKKAVVKEETLIFSKRVGGLSIASIPSNLEIKIDGHRIGFSPLKIEEIGAGFHTVSIKCSDVLWKDEKVTVYEGRLRTLTINCDGQ